MSLLSREIVTALASEYSPEMILQKISDPYWFQSFGCIVGFDWHSSGLTTTVLGALKHGIRGLEKDLGLFIAGGKGTTSRKTPEQLLHIGQKHSLDADKLIYASRMSAKVDSTAVQDSYHLYHHVILFTRKNNWAVIQQGMNTGNRTARRYHWLGSDMSNFVVEPHKAVCCNRKTPGLNMVARQSEAARVLTASLSRTDPDSVLHEIRSLENLNLTHRHTITVSDINPEKIRSVLLKTYERQPENFEKLLGIRGVGPKTVRALSLVSELLYGAPPSYRDPARFSFAHGGKDGTPYPVDTKTYDRTILIMKRAIESSRIGNREKITAIKRLSAFHNLSI